MKYSESNSRRIRLKRTIESLVAERQQVLVQYCQLAGVSSPDEATGTRRETKPSELQAFCQLLIDYIALGHFEIYQRIIEGKERRRSVIEMAGEVYPGIAKTTDFLVDFNDKYDDFTEEDTESLDQDLSRVGEVLALRGELEDRLLSSLEPKEETLV